MARSKHPLQPPVPVREVNDLPAPGDGSGLTEDDKYFREEVQLALRNRGMPLEAMHYPVTPSGLHYLLTHFDTPAVVSDEWRLEIAGLVSNPVSLSLDDIQARPAATMPVTMECAGNGRAMMAPRFLTQPWFEEAISTAEWTGIRLRDLLQEAGVDEQAEEFVFTGLDWGVQGGEVQAYQRSLTIDEAMRDEVLLAYAMNGEPLPPQHGYPLRLVVPDWYGMTSVKWLTHIEAVDRPFLGYQQAGAYRYQEDSEDPGERVTLMKPRALMIPPGIPDFVSRVRILQAGAVELIGRAWVGRSEIARVEVSDDNGQSWQTANLEAPVSEHAWRRWFCQWNATPGEHTLCVRAADVDGNQQPLEPPWNYQGMGNNMVQRVPVIVV